MSYRKLYNSPPSVFEKTEDTQIKNSSGAFVFEADIWTRLERFLILGSDAPTYYASAMTLTRHNAAVVTKCLGENHRRTIDTIVQVSQSGRAAKNDPALFALALAASYKLEDGAAGNEPWQHRETRQYALNQLPKVARTGTHLFHFADYVDGLRGWGRSLRTAIANWYLEADNNNLAYQVTKYQQRDGWSHRDLLRKSHPQTEDHIKQAVFRWITKGEKPKKEWEVPLIEALERAKVATTEQEIVNLIVDGWLTREMIPTQWLNSVAVWEALLHNMPMTAMVRNLGKMSAVGLLKPMANAAILVAGRLNNEEYIKRSRLHPLSILVAMTTYARGKGVRGSLTWQPVQGILDALDGAFYSAFDNVEPTNKRTMLALDVSGSMTWDDIQNMPGITPRIGSAAMAMVTARTEPNHMFTAFSTGMMPLKIGRRHSLNEVVRIVSGLPFGGTNCAAPMLYAIDNKLEIDTFIVYTDNETNYSTHPYQALNRYRQHTGIPAKLIVVGMIANNFSIADPNDAGMLDIVGFDTAAPTLISDFSARGMGVEF
jgi:60 kDa SS-A/Ro ribonucleoprotein